jgi:hypothetical protein
LRFAKIEFSAWSREDLRQLVQKGWDWMWRKVVETPHIYEKSHSHPPFTDEAFNKKFFLAGCWYVTHVSAYICLACVFNLIDSICPDTVYDIGWHMITRA